MQDETAAGFHRTTEMNMAFVIFRARFQIQLFQQIGESDAVDQLVDHQSHGAIGRMGAYINDGARKTRIFHLWHRDKNVTCKVS